MLMAKNAPGLSIGEWRAITSESMVCQLAYEMPFSYCFPTWYGGDQTLKDTELG